MTVSSLADGTVHELKPGDRMLERLDLAYAINVHVAQGVTARHGIVAMGSHERGLNTEKAFLVAMTRIADKATLVVDSGQKLERAVTRNPGEKTSALEMSGVQVRLPTSAETKVTTEALKQFTARFAEIERMHEMGVPAFPDQEDRLARASAMLDRLRPHGAEDLAILLDRDPRLGQDILSGRSQEAVRAWAEEGRLRADPIAYAERFIADWRAASAAVDSARAGPQALDAEARMERLNDRMAREPALERALDKRIPELHLKIPEPGMACSGGRDHGFELGL